MRWCILIARFTLGMLAPSGVAGPVLAHEAHKAECNATTLNATEADIQAMPDGATKTKAMQEMQIAEEMMAKNDKEGCVTHLHNAMEAVEE